MAKKQQPSMLDDVAEAPAESVAAEWMESIGRTFGLNMVPVPYAGWMSLVEMQRRNVDTLVAVNRMAMEGALELAECQFRILRETWGRVVSSGQSLLDGELSREAVVEQTHAVRLASERFLADTQAFSALVAKTNSGVSTAVGNRLAEMIEEIRQLGSQLKT